MSEESKNIVKLHLTDIYKADPGKVPTTSELIAEITKIASKNFKDKKIKIRIKLLDSYCPYFRIPKDTKFDLEQGLNMEGDYLVFEPTEAVASSAEAAEAAKAANAETTEAATNTSATTDTQQQTDIQKEKKGEIYVVVEGEAPDDDGDEDAKAKPNHWANIKNLFKATDAFQTMADKANQERFFNEIIEESIKKWHNNDPKGIELTKEQKEELKEEILKRTNMNKEKYNEIEKGLAEYFRKTSFERREKRDDI